MGLFSSLFSGVSGLTANGTAISVIGNNIANANTVGFKSSRVEFRDIISASDGAGGVQVGRGVAVRNTPTNFAQGNFQDTGGVLDLSIEGDGFFILRTGSGTGYSRAGAFQFDRSGNVINSSGAILQGLLLNDQGEPVGGRTDINIANQTSPPVPTGADISGGGGVRIAANLDATEAVPAAFDVDNPELTSSFSTTVTVFDSLGAAHEITTYFRKSAENAGPPPTTDWEWFATTDGGELAGGTAGQRVIGDSGTISFGSDGGIVGPDPTTVTPGQWSFANGADPNQEIGFYFGNPSGDRFASMTQFASPSTVNPQSQDGRPSGELASLQISDDGTFVGQFSNGSTLPIARVQLAAFASNQGLIRGEGGLFFETLESGAATIGDPSVGQFGSLVSGAIELSNVDIAEQFVQLIQHQRGFQASSRIITTTDALLAEVVNLTG